MTKFFKKALLIVSLIILILPLTSQTTFAATEPDLEASSAIAFDEKTGQVLYQNEPNKKVAIGSITKVLTLYLVTEAIHQHKLKWTDELKPTQEQAEMTQDAELTNVHLDVNQSYSVRSLYDAAWIVSSNSAAMMLAQRVSGTQEEFVRLMRKTLSLWGIKKAQIYNVSGLNNSDLKQDMYLGDSQAENKLSANDIAIITKHILDKYPEVLQTTSKQKFTFPDGNEEKTYTSLNLLLNGNRDYQAGYEFDGLKTGTTVQAGDSFIGTLPMDNTRIVTVTMNVKGESDDKDKRFRGALNLVKYIKENYTHEQVLSKNQKITINKKKYKIKNNVYMWLPNDFNKNSLRYNVSRTSLGFTAKTKNQTVRIVPKNLPNGYLSYKKVKKAKEKQILKKHSYTLWNRIGDFFRNLF